MFCMGVYFQLQPRFSVSRDVLWGIIGGFSYQIGDCESAITGYVYAITSVYII